jgi:hypothetical protein
MNPYFNEPMNETRAFPFYGGFGFPGYGFGFPGYGFGFPGYGFGWGYRPWFRPYGLGWGHPWI